MIVERQAPHETMVLLAFTRSTEMWVAMRLVAGACYYRET